MKTNQLQHLAIIMDGNGRWASRRFQPRTFGHAKGAEVARRIIEHAVRLEIPMITLFAFSTENWKRPSSEVAVLMRLVRRWVRTTESLFHERRLKFRAIGDLAGLDEATRESLEKLQTRTASYEGTTVVIAINYSGQQDILQAAAKNPQALELCLQAPAVDLVIRTGGERRLSNFFLWQAAYAEIHFCEKLWPDFTEMDLDKALSEFNKTERRFGAIPTPAFG